METCRANQKPAAASRKHHSNPRTPSFGTATYFQRSTLNGEVLDCPGDPLADALARLAMRGDRGLAFAVFLEVRGLPFGSAITPVFNFDFVLGPASDSDSDNGPDLVRTTALGLLPPTYESVWVLPGRGEPPEGIQERLRSDRAYGLANDTERFLELTSSMDWAATCRSAEAEARQIVLARPQTHSSIELARETAATRLDQLQALEQAQQGERLSDIQLQIKTLHSASELIETPVCESIPAAWCSWGRPHECLVARRSRRGR